MPIKKLFRKRVALGRGFVVRLSKVICFAANIWSKILYL